MSAVETSEERGTNGSHVHVCRHCLGCGIRPQRPNTSWSSESAETDMMNTFSSQSRSPLMQPSVPDMSRSTLRKLQSRDYDVLVVVRTLQFTNFLLVRGCTTLLAVRKTYRVCSTWLLVKGLGAQLVSGMHARGNKRTSIVGINENRWKTFVARNFSLAFS